MDVEQKKINTTWVAFRFIHFDKQVPLKVS